MASGDVSDYSDTSSLRQKIATAAGVDDASLVTISVAAGSVIITATIAVPASTTPAAVQTSLASTLGTAAAASAALGIIVESEPSITELLGQACVSLNITTTTAKWSKEQAWRIDDGSQGKNWMGSSKREDFG